MKLDPPVFVQDKSGFDDWLLPAASHLIPLARRAEWLREWRAEFWHLRHAQCSSFTHFAGFAERLSLAWGIIADAVCVGIHTLRQQKSGTAELCLSQLVVACLVCLLMERFCLDSWHSMRDAMAHFFLTRFLIVMPLAVFVALVSTPLRPRKRARAQAQSAKQIPVSARWQLFFVAKLVLSSSLAFLACALVSIPVRKVIGHNGDWLEFLMSIATLTSAIRLTFSDQMQRCQRCLRLLRQPVRVGPPSYNLLRWSGTELACADGHGMLQVPEMQGSWCWYDLWVELDPEWQSLFSHEG